MCKEKMTNGESGVLNRREELGVEDPAAGASGDADTSHLVGANDAFVVFGA